MVEALPNSDSGFTEEDDDEEYDDPKNREIPYERILAWQCKCMLNPPTPYM